jgi:hypothetical protein
MKWAAAILAAVAMAGLAYTTIYDAGQKPRTSQDSQVPSIPAGPPIEKTLGGAIAQFETIYAELLREERAAVLETSAAARESRAQRIRELRAQSGELERLIEKLSAPPISTNAGPAK